jgi:hypothetical protein
MSDKNFQTSLKTRKPDVFGTAEFNHYLRIFNWITIHFYSNFT